ncbi:hypothetical protein TrVGV298_011312 [Trichoderma virens]|nr:hypothetical protein TrVGV298_011312 [Trichoderma virens]
MPSAAVLTWSPLQSHHLYPPSTCHGTCSPIIFRSGKTQRFSVLSSSAITTCLALLSLLSLVVLLLRPALRARVPVPCVDLRDAHTPPLDSTPIVNALPPLSSFLSPLPSGAGSGRETARAPTAALRWRFSTLWVWVPAAKKSNSSFLIPWTNSDQHWWPIFKSRSGAFVLSNTCSVPGRLSFTLTARIQYDAWMPASPSWDWSANARAGPNLIISPAMDSHLGCESACHPSTTVATPVIKFD